jgi:hypothetical protein
VLDVLRRRVLRGSEGTPVDEQHPSDGRRTAADRTRRPCMKRKW